MADTLDQIYMNTSIGATELDDGEHTLLTTNANTSYVIKDMFLSNRSILASDTHLELNGFNVSGATVNATGSLIIPPNSTLKLKSSTYPISYVQDEIMAMVSGRPYYEKVVRQATQTTAQGTTTTEVAATNTFTSSPANAMKVNYNVADSGSAYFYMETHDNNSAQGVYRMQPAGTQAESIYQNYVANGTGRMINGDFIGYTNSASNFYKVDLDASPQTGFTSSLFQSGVNPYPTSSYPRHFFALDHVWFIPSSGYDGSMYAISMNTGNVRSYSGMGSVTTSGNNFFCISADDVNDKIYIWRANSNEFRVTTITESKTSFLANQSQSGARPSTTVALTSIPQNINTSNPTRARLSPVPGGGIRYRGTDNKFYTIDISGAETESSFAYDTVSIGGAIRSVDYYDRTTRTMTASEVTAAGVTVPTFGLQLLGIKSET